MAGHSQFKNIMYRKGAQDSKRAKIFSKLIREITVAAKSGLPEPDKNPRLRSAIIAARSANMPKENIERAIKKASGTDNSENYEEVRYEGYGPGGVAVIVEALTDNRNRTASEVRAAFSKFGGSLAETGAVSFMFDRVGVLQYSIDEIDEEKLFETAIEAGASDVEFGEFGYTIYCETDKFGAIRDKLVHLAGEPKTATLDWRPQSEVAINESEAASLLKMLDVLDDNEDVQRVASNFEISEDMLLALSG